MLVANAAIVTASVVLQRAFAENKKPGCTGIDPTTSVAVKVVTQACAKQAGVTCRVVVLSGEGFG